MKTGGLGSALHTAGWDARPQDAKASSQRRTKIKLVPAACGPYFAIRRHSRSGRRSESTAAPRDAREAFQVAAYIKTHGCRCFPPFCSTSVSLSLRNTSLHTPTHAAPHICPSARRCTHRSVSRHCLSAQRLTAPLSPPLLLIANVTTHQSTIPRLLYVCHSTTAHYIALLPFECFLSCSSPS